MTLRSTSNSWSPGRESSNAILARLPESVRKELRIIGITYIHENRNYKLEICDTRGRRFTCEVNGFFILPEEFILHLCAVV